MNKHQWKRWRKATIADIKKNYPRTDPRRYFFLEIVKEKYKRREGGPTDTMPGGDKSE